MKTVTAIVIGAGHRGADAYAVYALQNPNELKIVGVAEAKEDRRREFELLHKIPKENVYDSWEKILDREKFADCVFICTQDKMHFEPLQKACEKGYHIFLEKPISPNKAELLEIRKIAKSYSKIISVAHVLRYSAFFSKIKKIIDSGEIGNVINIQHSESVGWWHQAHSFVRGNWRNSEESCPMILAKCCHDFDILLWLIGKDCKSVSSFGSLSHFVKENAPSNSPDFCLEGCPHKNECIFYAPRFYTENEESINGDMRRVVTIKSGNEAMLEELKTSQYGRCVYKCDNDVVDHQIVNMVFDEGITASLTMSAFSERCTRDITVQGTKGQITGCMEDNLVEHIDFLTGNKTKFDLVVPSSGHSGSDTLIMRQFVSMIANDGENLSSALQAVDSHLIALAAEESRINGGSSIFLEEFCK